jgi:hypothetical protein
MKLCIHRLQISSLSLSPTLTLRLGLLSPPQKCILFRDFIQISVVYWGKLINAIIAERGLGMGQRTREGVTTIATWVARWNGWIPLPTAVQIKPVWVGLSPEDDACFRLTYEEM